MRAMPKCVECGKTFDVEDARKEYNDEFNGDPNFYDDDYGDGSFCGTCAAAETSGPISQGFAAMNGD